MTHPAPPSDDAATWPTVDTAVTEPMPRPPLVERVADVTERLPLRPFARDPVEPIVTEPQPLPSSVRSEAPPLRPKALGEHEGKPGVVISVPEHDTEQLPLPIGERYTDDEETRTTTEHPAEAAWRARLPEQAAETASTQGTELARFHAQVMQALETGPHAEWAEARWQAMVAAGEAGPAFPARPGETEQDRVRRMLDDFERGCALERQRERVGPPIVAATTDGQPAAIYASPPAAVPSPNRAAHPVGARAEDKGRVLFDHTWKLVLPVVPTPPRPIEPAPSNVHPTPDAIESEAEPLDETTECRRAPTLRIPGAPVDPRRRVPTVRISRAPAAPSPPRMRSPLIPFALTLAVLGVTAMIATLHRHEESVSPARTSPGAPTSTAPTQPVVPSTSPPGPRSEPPMVPAEPGAYAAPPPSAPAAIDPAAPSMPTTSATTVRKPAPAPRRSAPALSASPFFDWPGDK